MPAHLGSARSVLFSDWLVKAPAFGQPPGGRITAYTQDRATYRDMQAGSLDHTGNPLDLTLSGDGFFTVQTPRGPRLTRAGHFQLGTNGTIVDEQGEALLDTNGPAAQDRTFGHRADGRRGWHACQRKRANRQDRCCKHGHDPAAGRGVAAL
jgi:flagellar hook-basal body protein